MTRVYYVKSDLTPTRYLSRGDAGEDCRTALKARLTGSAASQSRKCYTTFGRVVSTSKSE